MSEKSAVCADCGKQSPPTKTDYTLIGAEHGWRVLPDVQPNGKVLMKWSCPECWRVRKASMKPKPKSDPA